MSVDVDFSESDGEATVATATSRRLLYLAGGVVLLVLVVLAYLWIVSFSASPSSAARSSSPAPNFSAPRFDGGELRLADFRDQVVVLNFWAAWCPPCRAEAPILERVARAYRDRGVVFLGVDIQDNEADARAFLREFDVTYPNVIDAAGEIGAAYGLSGLPTTYFIDRSGRVTDRWVGPLSEQRLVARVDELLR